LRWWQLPVHAARVERGYRYGPLERGKRNTGPLTNAHGQDRVQFGHQSLQISRHRSGFCLTVLDVQASPFPLIHRRLPYGGTSGSLTVPFRSYDRLCGRTVCLLLKALPICALAL
jgi:hypothetical protein